MMAAPQGDDAEHQGAPNLYVASSTALVTQWLEVCRQVLTMNDITPHSGGGTPPPMRVPERGRRGARTSHGQCMICAYRGFLPHGGSWKWSGRWQLACVVLPDTPCRNRRDRAASSCTQLCRTCFDNNAALVAQATTVFRRLVGKRGAAAPARALPATEAATLAAGNGGVVVAAGSKRRRPVFVEGECRLRRVGPCDGDLMWRLPGGQLATAAPPRKVDTPPATSESRVSPPFPGVFAFCLEVVRVGTDLTESLSSPC